MSDGRDANARVARQLELLNAQATIRAGHRTRLELVGTKRKYVNFARIDPVPEAQIAQPGVFFALVRIVQDACDCARADGTSVSTGGSADDGLIGSFIVARNVCENYAEQVFDFLDLVDSAGTDAECAECPLLFAPVSVGTGEARRVHMAPLGESALRVLMAAHGVAPQPDVCMAGTLTDAMRARPELYDVLTRISVADELIIDKYCCIAKDYPDHAAKLAIKRAQHMIAVIEAARAQQPRADTGAAPTA